MLKFDAFLEGPMMSEPFLKCELTEKLRIYTFYGGFYLGKTLSQISSL